MAHQIPTRVKAADTHPAALLRPLNLFVWARLAELRLLADRCGPKPGGDHAPGKCTPLSRRPLI